MSFSKHSMRSTPSLKSSEKSLTCRECDSMTYTHTFFDTEVTAHFIKKITCYHMCLDPPTRDIYSLQIPMHCYTNFSTLLYLSSSDFQVPSQAVIEPVGKGTFLDLFPSIVDSFPRSKANRTAGHFRSIFNSQTFEDTLGENSSCCRSRISWVGLDKQRTAQRSSTQQLRMRKCCYGNGLVRIKWK